MFRQVGKYTTPKLKRAWQAAMHYHRKDKYARIIALPLEDVLVDPTFDTACAVNWTCGTGWTIDSGVASSDGTQVAASELSASTSKLDVDRTYRVVFEVTAYTAGNVKIKLGTGEGTNRAATGTFDEEITCTGSTTLAFEADADFVGSVDNVVIYRTE